MSDGEALPAGDFSSWLAEIRSALRGERGSDVPCDSCTACCTSSQFVHIEPDEIDTLSHIHPDLLFPAPRLPRGHVLLGYDQHGHCAMLIDNRCSIYEHRPRTCRTYDCRIFPAAGVEIDDVDKAMIASRAKRWRFSLPTEADRDEHGAVRAAARFLEDHPGAFPGGGPPSSVTERAVVAIEIHDLFLDRVVDPDPEVVRIELGRRPRPRRGT
jgi:Fe-S-cluster containining protein